MSEAEEEFSSIICMAHLLMANVLLIFFSDNKTRSTYKCLKSKQACKSFWCLTKQIPLPHMKYDSFCFYLIYPPGAVAAAVPKTLHFNVLSQDNAHLKKTKTSSSLLDAAQNFVACCCWLTECTHCQQQAGIQPKGKNVTTKLKY